MPDQTFITTPIDRESFRYGVLEALAERGISPTDLERVLTKTATGEAAATGMFGLPSFAGAVKGLGSALGSGADMATLAAVGLPVAAGAAAGAGAYALTRPDYQSSVVADQKGQEANALRLQARLLRLRQRRNPDFVATQQGGL